MDTGAMVGPQQTILGPVAGGQDPRPVPLRPDELRPIQHACCDLGTLHPRRNEPAESQLKELGERMGFAVTKVHTIGGDKGSGLKIVHLPGHYKSVDIEKLIQQDESSQLKDHFKPILRG